jgi:hypothetical protein
MRTRTGDTLRAGALALLVGTALSAVPSLWATAQTPAPDVSPVPVPSPAAEQPAGQPADDVTSDASGNAGDADAGDVATPADVDEAATLTEDELDTLVAPIALYPDALLAQIFVAATYPLDVVKASRWTAANKDMPEGERSDAADAEGWDPSVAVLAAGFPDVVDRMADEID